MQLHEELGAVRRETVLPVEREEAWEAVLDPAWLGDELAERDAVVEEVEEHRRLAIRWRGEGDVESLVEITFDDAREGTRVTVVEIPCSALRAAALSIPAAAPRGPLACV